MTMTRADDQKTRVVLDMVRADERAALRALRRPPPGTVHAQTLVVLTRALYKCVEKPPTRHRRFIISTRWRRNPWVAESHQVFVKSTSGWNRYTRVVDTRPHLFGEAGS